MRLLPVFLCVSLYLPIQNSSDIRAWLSETLPVQAIFKGEGVDYTVSWRVRGVQVNQCLMTLELEERLDLGRLSRTTRDTYKLLFSEVKSVAIEESPFRKQITGIHYGLTLTMGDKSIPRESVVEETRRFPSRSTSEVHEVVIIFPDKETAGRYLNAMTSLKTSCTSKKEPY